MRFEHQLIKPIGPIDPGNCRRRACAALLGAIGVRGLQGLQGRALAAALALTQTPARAQARQPAAADLLGRSMPYDEFEKLPAAALELAGGSRLRVAIVPSAMAPGRAAILDWVRAAAQAIRVYYGRFPVDSLAILVVAVPGGEIHGTTWGYQGAATRIVVGTEVSAASLSDDWVLVHEMVHVATPRLDRKHLWLTEGLATYVEPIARAQAGQLSVQRVWSEAVQGMPKGLPAAGDEGLDRTHTWGRTYWGGALFCLRADLEIRLRTQNRRGLQDALRAIVAAGGRNTSEWPIDELLATGDRATGVTVLADMYQSERAAPVMVDLDALWRRLGVIAAEGTVRFDDTAPDASLRLALTAPAR